MNPEQYNKLSGIEQMRLAVNTFSYCNETFLSRFSATELMIIFKVWVYCDYAFMPDKWTDRQVEHALSGIVPGFDVNEDPVYENLIAIDVK